MTRKENLVARETDTELEVFFLSALTCRPSRTRFVNQFVAGIFDFAHFLMYRDGVTR